MPATESHRSRVIGSPWPTLHATDIVSARHYPRHAHETYGVGLMYRGAQRSTSGRGSVDAHAGALITTNPGEVHDGRPLAGPTRHWRMVYLEPRLMETLAADVQGQAPDTVLALTRPVFDDMRLRAAFLRLFDRLDAWSAMPPAGMRDAAALACEESLIGTLAQLLERHTTSCNGTRADPPSPCRTVRDPLAERAREQLAAAFDTRAPTLAELAHDSGISRFQLLRRYTAAYGVPPHAWLLQRRVERARTLIRDGQATLADAAATCGFADQSHLTRVFTRHFGYTPVAWQAAISFKTRR